MSFIHEMTPEILDSEPKKHHYLSTGMNAQKNILLTMDILTAFPTPISSSVHQGLNLFPPALMFSPHPPFLWGGVVVWATSC